jgi:hypothetical protein
VLFEDLPVTVFTVTRGRSAPSTLVEFLKTTALRSQGFFLITSFHYTGQVNHAIF